MPSILGLPISQLTTEQTVALCLHWLTIPGTKLIFTPNPEIAVYARRHPDYQARLKAADLLIPDGMGIYLAGRPAIPERVTGVDLMLQLLKEVNGRAGQVGFVLRREGLSTKAELGATLQTHYPQIRYHCWYEDEVPPDAAADFLFVGLGFPKQEEWCYQRRQTQNSVKVMMAIGGGIDFLTGQQQRAPSFLRTIGLEWLWRLGRQPWRFKRILTATLIFPWLIFKERYGHNH